MHIGAPVSGDPLAQSQALDSAVPLAGLNGLAPRTLLPEASRGFPGRPGVEGHRPDGTGWAPRMTKTRVDVSDAGVVVTGVDEDAGLTQIVGIELHPSGVVSVDVSVTNDDITPYQLSGVTMCVPLPNSSREVMQLGGRWSNEFRPERRPFDGGAIEVENRAGRTSHDRYPAMFVGQQGFSEEQGEVLAAHLAWSGNARLRVEALSDGRRFLQAGDALLPGELLLETGETYQSPTLLLAWSDVGLNGISDCFHLLRPRSRHAQSVGRRCGRGRRRTICAR